MVKVAAMLPEREGGRSFLGHVIITRSHRLCGEQCVLCDVKVKGTGDLDKAGEKSKKTIWVLSH